MRKVLILFVLWIVVKDLYAMEKNTYKLYESFSNVIVSARHDMKPQDVEIFDILIKEGELATRIAHVKKLLKSCDSHEKSLVQNENEIKEALFDLTGLLWKWTDAFYSERHKISDQASAFLHNSPRPFDANHYLELLNSSSNASRKGLAAHSLYLRIWDFFETIPFAYQEFYREILEDQSSDGFKKALEKLCDRYQNNKNA